MTARKVMITIRSTRSGLSANGAPILSCGADAFDTEEYEPEEEVSYLQELLDAAEEDEPETVEMMLEGRLITTSRRVELVYEEFLNEDFGSSITKLGFDRDRPNLISMLRSGAVDTAMIFENHLRHICIYNAPAVGFEVCIRTVSVDNRLLTEGTLALDYFTEIRGVQTEHCNLILSIRNSD